MLILAPDKFKFSLSSVELTKYLLTIFKRYKPDLKIISMPMSDGGDGFLETLLFYNNYLHQQNIEISNPLLNANINSYILTNKNMCYIETSLTNGLNMIEHKFRNPLNTSSYGLGQAIKYAKDAGFDDIVIGIGGTGTNDGGIGMANALGFRFLDKNDKELIPIGKNLINIKKISIPAKGLKVKVTGLTDVDSVLTGQFGASMMFGTQKGANDIEIKILEEGMLNLSEILKNQFNLDIENLKGTGAGGGIGAGLIAFCDAKLTNGSEFMINFSGIKHYISHANVLITGEGKLDIQTLEGKLCKKVIGLCKNENLKKIGILGINELTNEQVYKLGFDQIYSIVKNKTDKEDPFADIYIILSRIAEQISDIYL